MSNRSDNPPQHKAGENATSSIRAIETTYRGYKFRSRLEARWAVFLDHMRHDWTYEPEGFQLPSVWYLPDFHLTKMDVFIEIKPSEPTEREKQIAREMTEGGRNYVLFYGSDPGSVFSGWTWPKNTAHGLPNQWDWTGFEHPGMWLPDLRRIGPGLLVFLGTLCWKQQITHRACEAARQARFEHGQSGAA